MHQLLDDFHISRFVRGIPGLSKKEVQRPLPGKPIESLLSEEERKEIAKTTLESEKALFSGRRHFELGRQSCALCHYFELADGKGVDELFLHAPSGKSDFVIAPTGVPSVWYRHAKFNHTSHRALKCAECHPGAEGSTRHADVLIPDRDSCIQCHAPTTKMGTPGVRYQCTECHTYHNGDHSLQGIGAVNRNPKVRHAIDDFLSGRR